ncbi:SGNH/GDSL hydrolase family protein [Nocardia africana]
MGDSFASGAGAPPLVSSELCGRSAVNYAHLVAQGLGVTRFRDVTCGGAKVADFSAPRVGETGDSEPPQYDALSADTTLVTVGIGGNDIGLVGLALRCLDVWHLAGYSCAVSNGTGDADVYANKIAGYADTYGTVIDEIHRRAPRAEILMIGYPTAFRPGGCPDVQPVLPADADYLEARIEQTNMVMEQQSAEHGARYVDLTESTKDHGACAAPDQRWLEGVAPVEAGASILHPNSKGHANAAKQILAAVRNHD